MDTKKLRQKILDLAIRGKLVPQDPNDEPASVLLERIKEEKERLIKEGKIRKSKRMASSDMPHYENVPFEVPKGWVWTTFGNVCKKLTDGSHNPPPKCSNGYTVISAQNIKNGKIVFTDKDRYTDELGFQKENPRTQITNGDIILGIIGGSIGNVAIYDLSVPVIAQRSISIIDTYVSNIYCFYLLQSTIFQSLFLEKSIGNAQAGVYLGELDKLYIPLPPLSEQQRIVTEIKRWFALIEQIEFDKADLQTTIKQTKSKILDLAIHGKLVPQDPNDEPAIELLKRINPDFTPCDNGHYTQLPKGWTTIKVGDVAIYTNGRAFKPEDWMHEGLPIIRIQNLNDNSASYNRTPKTYESKYLIHNGDLLFAWAASLGTYIWNGGKAWLNQHIFKVDPYPFIEKQYLYHVFKAMITEFYTQSHGSGMVHITKKQFENIKLLLPPLEEQKRIVQTLEQISTKLDVIMGSL
ncbi:restriction endonuclease subunit S [Bacteroides xylanisolvens]|uniref:restriction endonuclease subunit S n=1 Tax=Bacteroides TaxID=816 RepID=UPI0001DAABB0|nr:restriction endonuclease subunit S [Bacteroides sp. 3_1_23]EFI37537.1 type I restriction enzyme EcoAI specificity protein [Bacteroides sp. 3_1_23]MCS3334354.1 restriction endonuclease subunit S [Bacteroides xylanisolvens]